MAEIKYTIKVSFGGHFKELWITESENLSEQTLSKAAEKPFKSPYDAADKLKELLDQKPLLARRRDAGMVLCTEHMPGAESKTHTLALAAFLKTPKTYLADTYSLAFRAVPPAGQESAPDTITKGH